MKLNETIDLTNAMRKELLLMRADLQSLDAFAAMAETIGEIPSPGASNPEIASKAD